MSTLAVVEEILRETAVPMSVREIVERAGARLPSKSKTPDTVVARDLSMDIKKKGDTSLSRVRGAGGAAAAGLRCGSALIDGAGAAERSIVALSAASAAPASVRSVYRPGDVLTNNEVSPFLLMSIERSRATTVSGVFDLLGRR